jgi:catechol 2,3-dioxygenase-like lactoylglutathione lyase family enzyme
MLRLKNFEHIAIIASDFERSLQFYGDLGLDVLKRRGDGRQAAATLRMGDAEINMFGNPDLTGTGEAQRVHHFCLWMDAATIEDLLVDLRDAGIAITDGPVKRSDGMAVFVRDPDGLRIELLVKG